MSRRCLFNEQACFFDDNIIESSMLPICFRLGMATQIIWSISFVV